MVQWVLSPPGQLPWLEAATTLSFHFSWLVTAWSLQLLILWGIIVEKRSGCWVLRHHTISTGLQGNPTATAVSLINVHKNGFIQLACSAVGLSWELQVWPAELGWCRTCFERWCGWDNSAIPVDKCTDNGTPGFRALCIVYMNCWLIWIAWQQTKTYLRVDCFSCKPGFFLCPLTLLLHMTSLSLSVDVPLIFRCLQFKQVGIDLLAC